MSAFWDLGGKVVQIVPPFTNHQNIHNHGRHQPMLPVGPRGVCTNELLNSHSIPTHIRVAPHDKCTWKTVKFTTTSVVVTRDPSYPRWVYIMCNNGGYKVSGWIGAQHVLLQ